jgi:AGCS family alanine or glycine:cation symporter
MTAWSGAQASQVAGILNSPLFGDFHIPAALSGSLIALFTLAMLFGGIRRIGAFSAYLVPVMFTLYIGSSLWIILANVDRLGDVFAQIWSSAFSPQPMMSGVVVGGIVSALRWGIFKGIQCCEAGIGTQTIPHSMAQTDDATKQATLAMISTYTAGVVAFMSGVVSLLTNTWQDTSLPLGISMVAASFEIYFSSFGLLIIAVTTFLFAFGTILGNCYNGSQCFGYLTNNKKMHYYYIFSAMGVFVGAVSDVKTFWSFIDIILACAALPHVAALVLYASKEGAKAVSTEAEAIPN